MKKTTGIYPRLRVDTSRVSAVGQAGGVLLTETIRASGLGLGLTTSLDLGGSRPRSIWQLVRSIVSIRLTSGPACGGAEGRTHFREAGQSTPVVRSTPSARKPFLCGHH